MGHVRRARRRKCCDDIFFMHDTQRNILTQINIYHHRQQSSTFHSNMQLWRRFNFYHRVYLVGVCICVWNAVVSLTRHFSTNFCTFRSHCLIIIHGCLSSSCTVKRELSINHMISRSPSKHMIKSTQSSKLPAQYGRRLWQFDQCGWTINAFFHAQTLLICCWSLFVDGANCSVRDAGIDHHQCSISATHTHTQHVQHTDVRKRGKNESTQNTEVENLRIHTHKNKTV